MKNNVNVLVIRAAGTNCDKETARAFMLAGAASADLVHINALIRGEKKLADYQILAFPGGFSYGDDVSAGKIFATQLKYKLWEEVKEFEQRGNLVIGICNGFQILVKLGLLPGTEYTDDPSGQSATLWWNDSGRFECRWVYLKRENNSLWTKGLPEIIQLPIAHAEGKFLAEKEVLAGIVKNKQISFKYVDEKGSEKAPYPLNPNGSTMNIAGITNAAGNVFGLMPHPERFVSRYQYPAWTRMAGVKSPLFDGELGIGLAIFKNAVKYMREQ